MDGTILVATAGQGVLRSNDDGAHLGADPAGAGRRVRRHRALPRGPPRAAECRLRAAPTSAWPAATTPAPPGSRVPSPFDDQQVWSIAVDPQRPGLPPRRHRSTVARGDVPHAPTPATTWDRLPPEIPERCAGVSRPRILTVTVDRVRRPDRPGSASRRAGCGAAGTAATAGPASTARPRTSRTASPTPTSTASWSSRDRPRRPGVPGRQRALRQPRRRRDLDPDRHPEAVGHLLHPPGHAASPVPMRCCSVSATAPRAPRRRSSAPTTWPGPGRSPSSTPPRTPPCGPSACTPPTPASSFAGTKYGHLFRSTDGGRTCTKEWREFPEITDVAWTPPRRPGPARDPLMRHRKTPDKQSIDPDDRHSTRTPTHWRDAPHRPSPCAPHAPVAVRPRPRGLGRLVRRRARHGGSPPAARSGCSCPSA